MSLIERMAIREVIPGRLWQSGCPVPLEQIEEAGVNAVVNVGHALQPWVVEWMHRTVTENFRGPEKPRQRVHVHAPLWDAPDCLDPVACDVAISAAVRLLSDPWRRVLIHCEAGAFRSIHVTAGVLAAVEGLPPAKAFREADRRTGHRNPRESLGMDGWHEHVATFGRHRFPHESAVTP